MLELHLQRALILLAVLALFTGCSPKQFSSSNDASTNSVADTGNPPGGSNPGGNDPGGNGDDGAGTTIPQGPGGSNPGTGTTLPKLTFERTVCELGTLCKLAMILTPAPTAKMEINWKTDDALARTNVPVYSQPNIDYVPKADSTTFQVGQKTVNVYVQSIATGTGGKDIPIALLDCFYGGARVSCKSLVDP